MQTQMQPAVETSPIAGVYANQFQISMQPDGIVRVIFQDIIGGKAMDRQHIVMTTANAAMLANIISTMLQQSKPQSTAN